VSTFPDLNTLEKLTPEQVYLAFRERLAPPEDQPHVEFKYVGYQKDGDVGMIELTYDPGDGKGEKKAFIYVGEADGKIFLRLPDSTFRDL
jgi:hypothetical protein